MFMLLPPHLATLGAPDGTLETTGTEQAASMTGPAARQQPLTDVQRDVWVLCQMSPEGSAAYDLSSALRLRGPLDVDALRAAIDALVQRHEALRTTFAHTGDHQLVHPTGHIELSVIDLTGDPPAERAVRRVQILDAEMTVIYDLARGPLFRATLIREDARDHTLVLSAHHLVSDGMSFGVMQRDLGTLYSAAVGAGTALTEGATQYGEYVEWRADLGTMSEDFWLGLYEDPPAQLDLPLDRSRPAIRTFGYGSCQRWLGPDLAGDVRRVAVEQRVTPFAVLLAGWEVLLHRLSGQSDFPSGVFVSGQAAMGVRDLVGLCAGLLPLRARITPDESVAEYVRRLGRSTFDAFDYQDHTVARLASALHIPREASRPTLVSTVMTLETPTQGIDFAGLEVTEAGSGRRRFGSFDFEAYLTETDDDLLVDFQFVETAFDEATIERWLGHYAHLLRQMVADPGGRVADLRLLDDIERRELLGRWNDTAAAIPDEATPARFERQVASDPARVAVSGTTGSLTYGELDARANRLARLLRDLGVGPDRLVGVHLERSPGMLVALLAVLKAGGAYVPLDPQFPAERLAMIATDAGLDVLVTRSSLLGTLSVPGAAVVDLDRDAAAIEARNASGLGLPIGPTDLAYVIYTSGSTGRPKGVAIPHLALGNLLESMRLRPGLGPDDRLLAVTTMSFDIAGLELFLPLVTGATVVLADAEQAVDAGWLRDRLGEGDVSVMQATPATWQLMIDAGWAGTPGLKALCGGEALGPELAAALGHRVGSLWNMYGPTETTIWSSVSRVEAGAPITLGEPIANTEFHVLGAAGELQPLGVPGELFIGGAGLARGYHARPDLTAERFVERRLDDGPPRRLYRTGDMVRRVADGSIEYIGRADFQVKIRGFRIELGEIEAVLGRHPDVHECVVAARDGDGGHKRLVAYVVPAPGRHVDVSVLRAALRETLPDYMVPALFVELDAFPMTANKKVDRTRLPEPASERPVLATELVAPRTPAEATLARIWREALGVERVGIHDDFFDLGGDSLLALRSIMRANREGVPLAPNAIFRSQTIAELAALAERAAVTTGDDDEPVGSVPLTPAQLRFLTERDSPEPQHWNVSTLVETETLAPEALRVAVAAVLEHHDALRLRLWRSDDGWHQAVLPGANTIPFETHDLAGLSPVERAATIERICGRIQESFDLGEGLLLRVAHFACGPDAADRLFVVVHHFAVDMLTFGVLWEDLEDAYRQATRGSTITLPAKTTSFRAWALQLERLARQPRVQETLTSWTDLPWQDVAPLPTDRSAGPRSNTNGSAAAIEVDLDAEATRRLLSGRRRPEHVILAALGQVLGRWTSSPTVLIDVLSHGRDAALDGVNLSRTVGFMLSYNPIVLTHPTWTQADVLDPLVRQIEATPEGFTFELLRFLGPDHDVRARLSGLPRAEVLFNFAGVTAGLEDDEPWQVVHEPSGQRSSPRGLRQYPLAVRAALAPDLRLTFVYSTELHEVSTIQARANEVAGVVRALVD